MAVTKLIKKGVKKAYQRYTKKDYIEAAKELKKQKATPKRKPLTKTQLKALEKKHRESSDKVRFAHLNKKKTTTAKPKSDYVIIPKKAYTDEEKYNKMMRSGKKLTDAQLKAYSKAVKFTVDNMIEIQGRQYVTRKAKQTLKGTVAHALDEMRDFLPKKYLDLYKKK
tara:strand:+ start:603 stop:1103 length:501 start_codon:yes stop_codon:yes gene_type:complete